MLEKLIKNLKQHESTETRDQTETDNILIGMLNLINELLNFHPRLRKAFGDPKTHDLVSTVFSTCLFYINQEEQQLGEYTENLTNKDIFGRNYVKTKGKKSREAAYKLLLTLCKDTPENVEILIL